MQEVQLRDKEQLLETYHQTEWILSKAVLIVLVAVYLPWFFMLKYDLFDQWKGLLFLWTLLVAGYGLRQYFIWYLHKYVITNQRLIHISHEAIFKKIVVETLIERILNVSFKTTGLFSSLFNYGDVEVQVVGLMDPIVLNNIKHPREIKDYLWELHRDTQKHGNTAINADIPHIQETIGYTKKNQRIV